LDPERLPAGRREDVDEPPADRYLSALLGPLDPLVPRERELFDEPVDPPLAADGELDRLRTCRRWRHPLGDGGRRRADEPARREDAEGARPLADEVRRRLEARLPAHPAARQEPDALLAEEPRRRLGRVARVRVLGAEE